MLKSVSAAMLALVQGIVGLFGLFSKAPVPPAQLKDCYPIVFVNGIGGWGQDAGLFSVMQIWGMFAGNMKDFMTEQGYEVYCANVGPDSSTWDRTCELYADLTGTRVDYGVAHSTEHGHARYGQTYDGPLVEDWSVDRKIHLVSHSFGGATIRQFSQLCQEGSAEEAAATPAAELSPLFAGDEKGKVSSLSTLSSPHNGSTCMEKPISYLGAGPLKLALSALALLGVASDAFEWLFPGRLGHFGLNSDAFRKSPLRTTIKFAEFMTGKDNAIDGSTIDGALEFNKTQRCQPDVYYFSYSSDVTDDDGSGSRVPVANVWPLLKLSSIEMGKQRPGFTTAGGYVVGDEWLPNDGLVNTISAMYPFGEPHKDFDADDIQPGVWNVMPVNREYDHADFGGGLKLGGAPGIFDFYIGWGKMLESITN